MTEEIDIIIREIGKKGGTGNVMASLGYSPADFQKGFDIANEMQNRDLVKLIYSNFNQNNIVVEFTLLGAKAFESAAGGKLTRDATDVKKDTKTL